MYQLVLTSKGVSKKLLITDSKLYFSALLIVVCLSYSSITPLFAEEEEILWFLEGGSLVSEPIQKEEYDRKNIFNDNSDESQRLELSILDIHDGDFVSGSSYSIDGKEISSTSQQGKSLNELLLQQKENWRQNWLHKIQYYDRYSDGYIELAEAMLDPVGDPDYIINGQRFDENPNSNMEWYLRERGYDTNNPEPIPNNAFSPVTYQDARDALKAVGNYEGVDLAELNNYYKILTAEEVQEFLIDDIEKQTTVQQLDIITEIISTFESTMQVERPLENIQTFEDMQRQEVTRIDNALFGESSGENIYQNTRHILQSPPVNVVDDPLPEYDLISIMAIVTSTIFLAMMGYLVFKKKVIIPPLRILLPEKFTQVNVTQVTLSMIEESLELLGNNKKKAAHERLSQAIRYYYSNKLGIRKELNSSEVVESLRKQKLANAKKIGSWLEFCGMVEFAKQDVNDSKFRRIISSFKRDLK